MEKSAIIEKNNEKEENTEEREHMNIGIVINLLAIVLFIALIVSHLNNRMWAESDKVFFALLLVCSLCAVTDMVDGFIDGVQSIPYVLLYMNTTGYFLFRNITPFLYICYIITIIDRWYFIGKNRVVSLVIVAPVTVAILVILLNSWTEAVFYYDAQHYYHRGPAVTVLYAIAAYYLILSGVYVWRYRDIIMKEKRLAIYAFVPISATCVGVQAVFPQIRIEMFGTAICVMMIMFTIQRHEEVLEGSTGLWNRYSFMQSVYRYFRNEMPFAVVCLHIGNLRVLNDTLGRLVVDDLLQDISQYIKSFRQETGYLYAMGNGKFNIILSRRNRHRADDIAERIHRKFQENWRFNGLELQLLGCVAVFQCPEDIENKELTLKFCDEFYKHMPAVGKILRVENFDWEKFRYREVLENIIEDALNEKKFEVYYQPIYSVEAGRITSAEALLRLYDEKYGFIPPDEFIPIAEDNMSILKIDRYVLEQVCQFIALNDLPSKGIHYIEVNLSAVQCMQSDMADQVLEIINRYHINPHCINLELTESAMMYSPDMMKKNMQLLRKHGIAFSMDDFGSGYSNLNYLFEFPFSVVKLDRGIVCTKKESSRKWIILKHSILMLQDIGVEIVAEGVETQEMVEDLIRQGCQYLQGFYYSKALPDEAFLDYIARME